MLATKQFCPANDWASAAFGQTNIFQRSARQSAQGCALNLSVFQLVESSRTSETITFTLKYDITSDEGSCYTVLSSQLLLNMSPNSSIERCVSEPLNTRRGVHDLTFAIDLDDLAPGDYTLQVKFTGRGVPVILRSQDFVVV